MTKRVVEKEEGRIIKTCKTSRKNKAERQAIATFRAQGAIKFILNLPQETVSTR